MSKESELSLAQRVHLAQGDIKSFLKTPLIAIGIGIIIIAVVIPVTLETREFIFDFGYYEPRLNTADGPECNPDLFTGDVSTYPSQIVVIEGGGAEKAGIRSGDIITSINGISIISNGALDNWANAVPGIKPGDFVDVEVVRDGNLLSFSVQTTPRSDVTTEPLLGILTAGSCISYFFLNDGEEFTEEALRVVYDKLDIILLTSGIMGAILIYFAFTLVGQLRKLRSEVADWENAYLDQNYILTFETNPPTGSTDGEKIFNMAQTVFPELRKPNGKLEKWKGIVKGTDGYEFDCFQTTNAKKDEEKEILVVKHFGDMEITKEKLQELCNAAKKSREEKSVEKRIENAHEMEIFRVICVGRNYESKLMKNEKYQDSVMADLNFDSLIDLILEEKGNYTVIRFETE